MSHRARLFLALTVVVGSSADAAERMPARMLRGAAVPPAMLASYRSIDDCCTPAAAPCKVYQPCVAYRGRLDCCGPTVKQTLKVQNPCDCCCAIAEVPVCLPACCKDPCVDSKCGLLGCRGVVTYSYDCGVCVKVVFNKHGDVVVVYRG